jgi:hypothetical protein
MAYMTRLGLWGDGTDFTDFYDFLGSGFSLIFLFFKNSKYFLHVAFGLLLVIV